MTSPAVRTGEILATPAMAAPPARRGWCPSAHRPMETGDGWLARVRPMAGALDADQAARLARWASTAGNGALDLTRRGNLQIRGLTSAAALELAGGLVTMDLAAPSADAEARRVVLAVAATDNDPAAIAPVTGLAVSLDAGLRALPHADLPETCALPEKALIVVNGGGRFALCEHSADLRLDAVATASGPHWRLSVNGTRSTATPVAMLSADDRIAAQGTLDVLSRALAAMPADSGRAGLRAALAALADDIPTPAPTIGSTLPCSNIGIDCRKNDFHTLIVPGASGSGSPIGVGDDQGRSVDARKSCESRSGSTGDPTIGPLADIGLGVGFAFGALDAAMLSALSILARDAGDGQLCLLPTHAIVVPGDPDALLSHPMLTELTAGGAIIDPADPRLGLFACRGRQGCPKGTTDTRRDALALTGPLADYLGSGGRVHVSGCDKACAQPTPAAGITLTAADGRYTVAGPDAHRLIFDHVPNNTHTNGA